MSDRQQSYAVMLIFSSVLALVSVACNPVNWIKHTVEPTQSAETVDSSTPATPDPISTTEVAEPSRISNPYQEALDIAQSAIYISQSAQSVEDWNLVVNRWEQAIGLLQTIPPSTSNAAIAQAKIAEYQGYLSLAQQQTPASPASPKPAIAISKTPQQTPVIQAVPQVQPQQVFVAKIKRRVSRTPVIDVTFNQQQTFEMILDTGASTTVITPAMAAQLGVNQDTFFMADTASDKKVKFGAGKVRSIAVAGAVANNIQVAISGSALNIGLLGQDFFSNYDVLLKQDVVEFYPR